MTTFVTRETICSAVKLNLLGGGGEGIRNLILDHMLPKSLILECRTASVIVDMRPPTVCTLWTVFVQMSFTTHNTFLFFSTTLCLVPKTLALETLLN